MKLFLDFKEAATLEVDFGSEKNEKPPLPDIGCTISGSPYFFELGQIVDEELARDVNTSRRTGADEASGWFSAEGPLVRIIRNKAGSSYQTNGAPVDLVLYYDEQYPFESADYLGKYGGEVAQALNPGPFTRIWIYDTWTKTIVWQTG